jgi:hypothetical protein
MFFLYFCGFAGGSYLMQHHGYTFKDVLQVCLTCNKNRVCAYRWCARSCAAEPTTDLPKMYLRQFSLSVNTELRK